METGDRDQMTQGHKTLDRRQGKEGIRHQTGQ